MIVNFMDRVLFAVLVLVSLSVVLGSQQVFAAQVNSVGTGNWNAPGTWDVGVPNPGDDITIKNGHTVTVTDVRTLTASLTIDLGGGLVIDGTQAGRLTFNQASLSNGGTITLIGGNNLADGSISGTTNGFTLTNTNTITGTGGSGQNSGGLFVGHGPPSSNSGTMSFTGSSGQGSGILLNTNSIFSNSGTMTFVGGSGFISGFFSHTTSATTINECIGTMSFTGGDGERSGAMGLFGDSTLTNNGGITLTGGSGETSGGIFMEDGTVNNHNIIIQKGGPGLDSGIVIVVNTGAFNDNLQNNCPSEIVGGEFLPIETTSLLLANAQTFSWMIPVILSGIGIGLFVVSRKSENS